jgi:hypothetical protein
MATTGEAPLLSASKAKNPFMVPMSSKDLPLSSWAEGNRYFSSHPGESADQPTIPGVV